jgi:hypothetical protein
LKCTLATCIVSRFGFLRRLHLGAAAVAGGEVRGLSHQGPALLLALAAPISVVHRGRGGEIGATTRAAGRARGAAERAVEQEQVGRAEWEMDR